MNMKLTNRDRAEIYLLWLRGWTLQQLGDRYGVRKTTIWYTINNIIRGKFEEGKHYDVLCEVLAAGIK